MTQEFIVLLLVGLVGVIWVIVLDIRGDKQSPPRQAGRKPLTGTA